MNFVGVDGCPAGWIAVRLIDGRDWDVQLFRSGDATRPWNSYGSETLILIDTPIGLPDKAFAVRKGSPVRDCDQQARKLLGQFHSRVFNPPSRVALAAPTRQEADRLNKRELEVAPGIKAGVSEQAWGIASKIRELDELLRSGGSGPKPGTIREVHPEICFWALNNSKPVESRKKGKPGREERLKILHHYDRNAKKVVERANAFYRGRGVNVDDIIDAFAAALTAKLGHPNRLVTIPDKPERDSEGLAMEMVYCSGSD